MRVATITLLFSFALGVAGLSCYLGTSFNSTLKVDCVPGTNYCYRQVTTTPNSVTYAYNCDSTRTSCSGSGNQNTGVNGVTRKCCSSNYCNTNSGASLGSIATVIASAVFVLKFTL